jgi:UDP-N-acetylmuramate: L-alanyl-gamma-D-glutamyl-meso-diaminopimelate ligase
VRALAEHADATVRTYGLDDANDARASDLTATPDGQRFSLRLGEARTEALLPMYGPHNVQNALAAALLAHREGVRRSAIVEGLASFAGMKRRQEVRGRPNDVLVLDDFAHHPTAVRTTIEAVRAAHPDRRLVAVFEPRSNSSRRKIFETPYGEAFDRADAAFLKAPPVRHNDDADTMLDPEAVVRSIRERGTPADAFEDVDGMLPALLDTLRPGDVALLMSNGSFDGLHDRLLAALDPSS